MPVLKKLKELLDQEKISYQVYSHPRAFTAQEIAASQHFSGKEMAKVVMLNIDGSLAMAVIPGNRAVSLRMVKSALGCKEARLATEDEFASRFPECEIGAMPPFGNLFGIPVYVDTTLEADETIFFNAGNHQQTVRMKFKDFKKLVEPNVVPLTHMKTKMAA
jgi:Ala-tRNA(Pro) deacylase